MSCCIKNRNIIGIIVGSIYTLFFLKVFIFSLYTFFTTTDMSIKYDHECPGSSSLMAELIVSFTAALISVLYVLANVKRLPWLIIPWLLLCIFIFLSTCFFISVHLFGAAWHGASDYELILILLIGACLLGIQIAIFCLSCFMYLNGYEEPTNINTTLV